MSFKKTPPSKVLLQYFYKKKDQWSVFPRLTPAEERYSNIKRELLGVVFAMERLHHYVYGEPVRIQTDHKVIWRKRIATASPRLQRLASYEIQLEFISGKDNTVAEALSQVDPPSPKPIDIKQMDSSVSNFLRHSGNGQPSSQD